MKSWQWFGALATLAAAAASGREPNVSGFKSYAMPAYTIVTHDENAVRQVPTAIARIDGLLAKMFKPEGRSVAAPTYLLVAPENLWDDFLEPGTGIGGEYVSGRFVNYILVRNNREDHFRLLASVFHEYTHLFLRTQFRGTFPLWFDEGAAQLMQYVRFRAASAIVGIPPALSLGWIPLERLFVLDKSSPEYRSTAHTGSVHSESWALVHRGMVGSPTFGKQMMSFIDAVKNSEPIDEAVRSSFGKTMKQLNRDIYHYVGRSSFETDVVPLELAPPVTLETGRSMSELEALQLLADIMLVSGFKPARLAEVIDTAHRRAPDSPGVHVLRLRLAVRDRADAAIERLLEEIEPHLADPEVARGAGLALFERVRELREKDPLPVADRDRLSARAFELLDRAIAARPGDPEAIWAYGMLAAATKRELSTALQRVKAIRVQAPFNPDLSMAEAMLHEALGDTAGMISALADTARFTGSAQERLWARQRIDAVTTAAKPVK